MHSSEVAIQFLPFVEKKDRGERKWTSRDGDPCLSPSSHSVILKLRLSAFAELIDICTILRFCSDVVQICLIFSPDRAAVVSAVCSFVILCSML